MLQHGLRIRDFIVFEHKGKLVFDVLIFDSSSCEKEFPLRNVLPNKRKRMIPVAEDSTHADDTKPLKGILFFSINYGKIAFRHFSLLTRKSNVIMVIKIKLQGTNKKKAICFYYYY